MKGRGGGEAKEEEEERRRRMRNSQGDVKTGSRKIHFEALSQDKNFSIRNRGGGRAPKEEEGERRRRMRNYQEQKKRRCERKLSLKSGKALFLSREEEEE